MTVRKTTKKVTKAPKEVWVWCGEDFDFGNATFKSFEDAKKNFEECVKNGDWSVSHDEPIMFFKLTKTVVAESNITFKEIK